MINLTTPEVRMNKGTVDYSKNYKLMPESTISDQIRKQSAKIKLGNTTIKTTINTSLVRSKEDMKKASIQYANLRGY